MKLTAADRELLSLISQTYPPQMADDPQKQPSAADWAEVIARAERRGLAPLLFDSIKDKGRLDEIPSSALLDFRRAYLRSANQNEENFRELAALLDALDGARIPVILLKGAALAVALYDRIAQRPMCDLDLLIPKDALPDFEKILIGRGFVGRGNLGKGFEQEFMSELCYVRPGASRLTVEPHWHLFNSTYYAAKIPIAWFWEHTAPVEIPGRRAQMLSPLATLLHLAGHYSVHHQSKGLLPLYDIARVLTRWPDRIDGDELTETARSLGLLSAVQAVLREVSAIWQVPLPANFSFDADQSGGLPAPEIAGPYRYSHHVRDLMGIAGLKMRFVYLWKLMFPGAEYLRQRYGMRDERLAAFYYGYRMVRFVAGACGILLASAQRKVSRARGGDAAKLVD